MKRKRDWNDVPRGDAKPSYLDVLILEATRIIESLKVAGDQTNFRICFSAVDRATPKSLTTYRKLGSSGRIVTKTKARLKRGRYGNQESLYKFYGDLHSL